MKTTTKREKVMEIGRLSGGPLDGTEAIVERGIMFAKIWDDKSFFWHGYRYSHFTEDHEEIWEYDFTYKR